MPSFFYGRIMDYINYIKNYTCCLKCGESVLKENLKNHICYKNLEQEKKEIKEKRGKNEQTRK
jgi:hypothetical protein